MPPWAPVKDNMLARSRSALRLPVGSGEVCYPHVHTPTHNFFAGDTIPAQYHGVSGTGHHVYEFTA